MCFSADFCDLPTDCVTKIISLTSPTDACRLALVSNVLKSVSESDSVWEKFLPNDLHDIIGRSDSGSDAEFQCLLLCFSKKQLFFRLSHFPLLIDSGLKSFFLDKLTGKKCYMISARDLDIVWADTPTYWNWTQFPESIFPEVAELRSVCWLEIHGKIDSSLLSSNTNYAAYLIFKFNERSYGFDDQPVEVSIAIRGVTTYTKNVYLNYSEADQPRPRRHYIVPRRVALFSRARAHILEQQATRGPVSGRTSLEAKKRRDGWFEIELGEWFVNGGEVGEVEMSLSEVKGGHWKAGLIVQSIEVRPKWVLCK